MTQPSRDIWGDYIKGSPYEKQCFGTGDPHLLFVGSEKSGKTTLQNIFFGRSDEPSPTLALTYQSCNIKVSNRSVTLHLWELGGGVQLESILDTVVTEQTQLGFVIFVCVNLMSPSSIIEAVDWIDRIQARFGDRKRAVFFVGTHYDVFEAKDPRDKDMIVKGLRAIAAQANAGIVFTSNRHDALMNRFKNVIKYVAIANSRIKEKSLEISSPVVVGPGEDKEAKNDNQSVSIMLSQIRDEAVSEREKMDKDLTNPAENPQFAEEEIDSLRAARREELDEKRKVAAAKAAGKKPKAK